MIAVADARIDIRFDVARKVVARGVEGAVRAGEVHPVDGPRVLTVCTIRVGNARRQDEELVGFHLVSLSVEQIPPRTLYAIDQDVLVDAHLAFTEVVTGGRVVTDVGEVEARHQRIGFLHLDNHLREDDGPFASKSILEMLHVWVEGRK